MPPACSSGLDTVNDALARGEVEQVTASWEAWMMVMLYNMGKYCEYCDVCQSLSAATQPGSPASRG